MLRKTPFLWGKESKVSTRFCSWPQHEALPSEPLYQACPCGLRTQVKPMDQDIRPNSVPSQPQQTQAQYLLQHQMAPVDLVTGPGPLELVIAFIPVVAVPHRYTWTQYPGPIIWTPVPGLPQQTRVKSLSLHPSIISAPVNLAYRRTAMDPGTRSSCPWTQRDGSLRIPGWAEWWRAFPAKDNQRRLKRGTYFFKCADTNAKPQELRIVMETWYHQRNNKLPDKNSN